MRVFLTLIFLSTSILCPAQENTEKLQSALNMAKNYENFFRSNLNELKKHIEQNWQEVETVSEGRELAAKIFDKIEGWENIDLPPMGHIQSLSFPQLVETIESARSREYIYNPFPLNKLPSSSSLNIFYFDPITILGHSGTGVIYFNFYATIKETDAENGRHTIRMKWTMRINRKTGKILTTGDWFTSIFFPRHQLYISELIIDGIGQDFSLEDIDRLKPVILATMKDKTD